MSRGLLRGSQRPRVGLQVWPDFGLEAWTPAGEVSGADVAEVTSASPPPSSEDAPSPAVARRSLHRACRRRAPSPPHVAGRARSRVCRPSCRGPAGVEGVRGYPPTELSVKVPTLLFLPPRCGGTAAPSPAAAVAGCFLFAWLALRWPWALWPPDGMPPRLPRDQASTSHTCGSLCCFRSFICQRGFEGERDPYLPTTGLSYSWGFVI